MARRRGPVIIPRFMLLFWKYGFTARVFYRFIYFGFKPGYNPLFSERHGHTKVYRFAGFVFKTEAGNG